MHHEPAITFKHASHIARTKIILGGKEKKEEEKKSAKRFVLYSCNKPEYNMSRLYNSQVMGKNSRYTRANTVTVINGNFKNVIMPSVMMNQPHKTTVKAGHSK